MKVLFVYFVPSGGVETLNRQRSLALKKVNIECHFLYYSKVRDLVNDHYGATFITNDGTEIKKILARGNYDAVIITSDYHAFPRFRNLGYKGKIIFEIQGFGAKAAARETLRQAIPYVTRYSNGILTSQTPHIVQILQELYPSFPTFVFHNCFDHTTFSYQLLPKQKRPIIAWIGRIEENKNWREFLQLGHRLIYKHNQTIRLYMFEDPTLSEPSERTAFQQLLKNLQLKNHVKTYANVPHGKMAEYLSIIGDSGGFLCSTSKVESFGYAIVEAMSCRCPVLTTDSDGVRSSIIHNVTGKYYTLGNIDEAFIQAKELMTNLTLREQIRTQGLEHIKVHYSLEGYAQNFKNMLTALGNVSN